MKSWLAKQNEEWFSDIPVHIYRSARRSISLSVEKEGLKFRCPQQLSYARMSDIIAKKKDWILRQWQRQKIREQKSYIYTGGNEIYWLGKKYCFNQINGPTKLCFQGETLYFSCRGSFEQCFYRLTNPYLKDVILQMWEPYLKELAKDGYRQVPTLVFRKMKRRWGSCAIHKNIIQLNSKLIFYPPATIGAVLWHECVHFLHPNHSPAFYRRVLDFMPDYYQRLDVLM